MFYFYTIIEISQIYILSLHDALPILGGDCMNRLELMSKIYDRQMEIVNILKKYHSTVDIYNYQNLTGYVLNNNKINERDKRMLKYLGDETHRLCDILKLNEENDNEE